MLRSESRGRFIRNCASRRKTSGCKAALARIDADRINARETAAPIFGEGRSSEQEGERLLRERDYDAAQLAFGRAARLFEQAQELTWQERVRRTDLAAGQRAPERLPGAVG